MRILLFFFLATLTSGVLGKAQNLIVLYNFVIRDADPQCTLIETSPGTFYGGTSDGLFSITSAGVFSELFSFDPYIGDPLGTGPAAGVIQASSGYLYGPTYLGGTTGGGSLYRSDLAGNVTVFNTDVYQSSPLVEGLDGNFYGITGSPAGDASSFFRITAAGVYTTLYALPAALNAQPLVLASDGNFYGVTPGSSTVAGVIYRLIPSGEYTVIHTFSVNEGGTNSLMEASNGLLYGSYFGASNCSAPDNGDGIFSISLKGVYTVVEKFPPCGSGGTVESGLVEGSDGNIYGAETGTFSLAPFIFKMSLNGSSFNYETTLCYQCGNALAAYGPAFMQGSDGKFYGTSVSGGGPTGSGTVFQFDASLTPPLPRVAIFQPMTGAAGTQVRIKGSHLVGLSGVSFNGVAASFVSRGNDYAIADVPAGATSGPITVTTMNGSATSKTSFNIQ